MPSPKKAQKATATQSDAVNNVNRLTLAFAYAAAKHQSDKADNLVVSPYNALACLAMLAKGADGNTKAELALALFGVAANDVDAQAAAYAALDQAVLAANQGQVELKTANGVWTNKELLTLNTVFADELKKVFGAEVSEEKFSDPAVAQKINDWAAKNTNNLINKIVAQLEPLDYAVLASALYFKGKWTKPFKKERTEDKDFALDGGAVLSTPTMHGNYRRGEFTYQEGDDYQAVALTYGEKDVQKGKVPTMRIVLIRPEDPTVSARDWLAQQGGTTADWMDSTGFHANLIGSVELPRIDIKQKHDIVPVLKELGIKDAFTGAADFSPMTVQGSKNLFVSSATQDVVFKTDEKGSEAAAVTTVTVAMKAMPRPEPRIDIQFDRSFVFALQDVATGALLFVGAVNKPNNDMKPKQPHTYRVER